MSNLVHTIDKPLKATKKKMLNYIKKTVSNNSSLTCNEEACQFSLSIMSSKRQCAKCERDFCAEHVCHRDDLAHLKGKFHPGVEAAISGEYLCKSCFGTEDFPLSDWQVSLYENICHHKGCKNDLTEKKNKYACISCGKLYCNKHNRKLTEKDFNWLKEDHYYFSAEHICDDCDKPQEESSEEIPEFHNHPETDFLKLLAGAPSGKRKAIIVHGLFSHPSYMYAQAESLIKHNVFDSVWSFNSLAYTGRVHEVAIPSLGIEISKSATKSALKFGAAGIFLGTTVPFALLGGLGTAVKSFDVEKLGNFPPYIVEGAAQSLVQVIKSLNMENTTLIGHSYGGLVVRCAAENYDLSFFVEKIITLGSPHRLWNNFHKSHQWELTPNKNISYLALVGANDPFLKIPNSCNYTEDDTQYKNIIKVVVDGEDHSSIHEQPERSYAIHIIAEFMKSSDMFNADSHFTLQKKKNTDNQMEFFLHHEKLHSSDYYKNCNYEDVTDWLIFRGSE